MDLAKGGDIPWIWLRGGGIIHWLKLSTPPLKHKCSANHLLKVFLYKWVSLYCISVKNICMCAYTTYKSSLFMWVRNRVCKLIDIMTVVKLTNTHWDQTFIIYHQTNSHTLENKHWERSFLVCTCTLRNLCYRGGRGLTRLHGVCCMNLSIANENEGEVYLMISCEWSVPSVNFAPRVFYITMLSFVVSVFKICRSMLVQ